MFLAIFLAMVGIQTKTSMPHIPTWDKSSYNECKLWQIAQLALDQSMVGVPKRIISFCI
jgi:hypothetical protein